MLQDYVGQIAHLFKVKFVRDHLLKNISQKYRILNHENLIETVNIAAKIIATSPSVLRLFTQISVGKQMDVYPIKFHISARKNTTETE